MKPERVDAIVIGNENAHTTIIPDETGSGEKIREWP
jgi:hypothetical protein